MANMRIIIQTADHEEITRVALPKQAVLGMLATAMLDEGVPPATVSHLKGVINTVELIVAN